MNGSTDKLSPTALAFIGDAVHTLYIRKAVIHRAAGATLHLAASEHCNAAAQAAVFDELVRRDAFTDDELDMARRARNAHLHSRTKASSAEYHKSTALEAVIGMLEVSGDEARKQELLGLCAEISGLNGN